MILLRYYHFRHKRRVLQDQPAEQITQAEDKIVDLYQAIFYTFSFICLTISVINYSQDLKMSPPQKVCTRSGEDTNIINFFIWFLLPFVILSVLTIGVSTNWQCPNLNQIYNEVTLKPSIMATLLLFAPMPSVLKGLGILEMSNNFEFLLDCTLFLPFVALKGPLLLHWYTDTEDEQADDQAPEEFEMQNV